MYGPECWKLRKQDEKGIPTAVISFLRKIADIRRALKVQNDDIIKLFVTSFDIVCTCMLSIYICICVCMLIIYACMPCTYRPIDMYLRISVEPLKRGCIKVFKFKQVNAFLTLMSFLKVFIF